MKNHLALLACLLILIGISLSGVIALDDTVRVIGAKKLHDSGIQGDDLTACIIDTGVDYTHTNLGGCSESQFLAGTCSKVLGGYDFGNADSNPMDAIGHGTIVSGIFSSTHQTYTGISPNSKIIIIKVFNDSWTGFEQDFFEKFFLNVKRGMRWCIDNSSKYNISVISMSIGNATSIFSDNCNDYYNLSPEVKDARVKNIPIIVAAGNSFNAMSPIYGLGYPSCLSNVTSVGATGNFNKMASFSDRDSTLDISAPGVDIRSTKLNGGFTNIFDDLVGCSPIFSWMFTCTSGTSFSTPQIAGAINLIKQYDSGMRVYQIEEMLKENSDLTSEGYRKINLLKAFHVLDWPTENHDYRRTGFTLLKGDLQEQNKVTSNINMFLDSTTGSEHVVKATVADLDGNDRMDQVIFVHKNSINNLTKMYGLETGRLLKTKPAKKWSNPVEVIGGAVYFPATLADIDGDSNKEIVTGVRNGTIYAYEVSGSSISQKWKYHLTERLSDYSGIDEVYFNGGTAVVDIDLDGSNEVIFADVGPSELDGTWDGKVYVLTGSSGALETSYSVGNGGTYATISVANVDSDDNPEIVVPTRYGIKVLDYNAGSLSTKCSNNHGQIEGSAVIADVDMDNEYELIYVTNDRTCASGKSCSNNLFIINASSCTIELNKTLDDLPRPTPTIVNIDSDSQKEIIISTVRDTGANPNYALGNVTAIDPTTGTIQWSFSNSGSFHPGFISPNSADMDNDGNYNIITGDNNGSMIYVLDHLGTKKYSYSVIGYLDNGLSIADIDGDGMGEIVFKRAGSPQSIQTSLSSTNTPPEINTINNVTAIAGELINLNVTGKVSAPDSEGNNIDFFYSSPFNSSGLWQTTINDTGNYSILVEASDGNLSTYQYIDVYVFNSTSTRVNSFADGSTSKLLNFTQAGNLSVQVRLQKNTSIIYSKIIFEGKAP